MAQLRQLTPQDVMFVGGEGPKVYEHTAGLSLIDASERPEFGFEAFRQHLEQRVDRISHFHWKLHQVPLDLDLPYWVEDNNFSFDHHIRRIAVPSPGDHRALGELVSYLYARQMDRNRPLWEVWFIEGLANGQYALFQKLHHCLMDGQAAMKLSEAMVDAEPDAAPKSLDPEITDAHPGQPPGQWQESIIAARKLSRLPLNLTRELLDAGRTSLRKRFNPDSEQRVKAAAPTAHFNADIDSDRGFVFGSLPLADIKAVKNHFGVTVNDVVLALIGSSLRAYLTECGELPEESLRAMIAVSLRTEEDATFSNRVTLTDVTLGTDSDDLTQRLRSIAAETTEAKQQARGGDSKGVMEIMQLFPPLMVKLLMNMVPAESIAVQSSNANLLVSSVRGSDSPSYMGGARITAMYPMSVIAPGMGINVTLISYAGHVDFGVTLCPELFPDPWRIIDGLQAALVDHLKLTGSKGRRKKSKARPRAASKQRPKARPRPDPGEA